MEGEGFDVGRIADSITKISEPMFNLSMLDGINNAFKSITYSDGNYLTDFAVEAAIDYVSQGLPTLGGQISRTIDGTTRNSYYVDKNSPLPESVQRFLNSAQTKLPGLSFLLSPKVDQWGRTTNKDNVVLRAFENFISPGYISTRNETPVDKEISKLYDSTGETGILPSYASKSFTSQGETVRFTAPEYADFSKKRGQLSYDTINSILSDPDYQKLSADDKAELIRDIYGLSNAIAKSEVSDKYSLAKQYVKAYEAKKQAGIFYGDYLLYKLSLESTPTQQEVIDALNQTNLTKEQKRFLFKQRWPDSKNNPF